MTKPITNKTNKAEIYDAYLMVSAELEQLQKQLQPKPSLSDVTKQISYQLQDEVLSQNLKNIAMLICSYLVYLYVMGEAAQVKTKELADAMRQQMNQQFKSIPQLQEIING